MKKVASFIVLAVCAVVIAAPLKIVNGSGSPLRVIAITSG